MTVALEPPAPPAPEPPARPSLGHHWAARLVVALLALLIVGSAAATIRAMGGFLDSTRSATHSRQVVEGLNDLQTMFFDAETGLRASVLTGATEPLAALDDAERSAGPLLARLQADLEDNPQQMARLEALRPAITARLTDLQNLRALGQTAGPAAVGATMARGEDLRLLQATRAQIDAIRDAELALLQAREARTADRLQRTKQLLWLFALATVALLVLAIVLAERDFSRAAQRIGSEMAARREGQLLLSEQEEQGRAVRDSIIDAIITIDEEGIIQSANAATEQLFGYPVHEVVGRNVSMLMPAPYHDEHDGYLRAYRTTGVRKIIGIGREVTARRRDGSTFPVDLAVSEATVGHRRLFTGVLRDLSERKRADAEVRELQRLVQERGRLADIGAVTAQIVHDLGNPLAGLSMQVQRLVRLIRRRPEQFSEAAIGVATQVLGSVRRLDGMLQELGDFSRQQRLDAAPIDPARFLDAVAAAWRPVAEARGIALRVAAPAADLEIAGDYAKLFRVLDNLVKNAIEAIGAGPGEVCLALGVLAAQRPAVRISISDDGPGIPDDIDAFRLFETTKHGGSGLGLPIARRIVEAHGGALTFTTRVPRGTIFHIDLPLRPPQHRHADSAAQ
ncbi:PAS domain S-box protein [bacterium]|nr:PAS domain S-box protein [bacterium]